jgi:branched-chain amino acid aminotransferase
MENGLRMARSMEGLLMPVYPSDAFVRAVQKVVDRNRELGFSPAYDEAWESSDFISASTVYIRPFSYAESGIGVDLSVSPWVIIVTTTVGSYFNLESDASTITTRRVRATPGGTGWIKCSGNYVTSALAKKEAEATGCIEAIFLDSAEHRYLEEGSSCNLFAVLSDGRLVTPILGDTILPGITRQSVITLAGELGIKVEERRVSVEEVLDDAVEFFGTGTAAGVAHFGSLTHEGRTVTFGDGKIGPRALHFLQQLKGIQFGRLPDRHDWMVPAA